MNNSLLSLAEIQQVLTSVPVLVFLGSVGIVELVACRAGGASGKQYVSALLKLIVAAMCYFIWHRSAGLTQPHILLASLYTAALGIGVGFQKWKRSIRLPEEGSRKGAKYIWMYVAIWLSLYIIFPSWNWPDTSVKEKFTIQTILLLYFTICTFLFNTFLCKNSEEPRWRRSIHLESFFKSHAFLIGIGILFILLQLHPVFGPVEEVGGDETKHLATPLYIMEISRLDPHQVVDFLQIPLIAILCLACITVLFYKGSEKLRLLCTKIGLYRISPVYVIFVGLIFIYMDFTLMTKIDPRWFLFRYPPIGKLLYTCAYSLFGIEELFPRFIQIGFTLLSAVFLFRIVKLFRDTYTATLAFSIFLFLGLNFHELHRAYLTGGMIFFTICASFYFLRYVKMGRQSDLILTMLASGIGFLYKRPMFVMMFVFFSYMFLREVRHRSWSRMLTNIQTTLVGFSLILPWFVIDKTLSTVPQAGRLYPSTVMSIDIVSAYLKALYKHVPIFFFCLFLIGIFYAIARRKESLGKFCLLWFTGFYTLISFFVDPIWTPHRRFILWLYPSVIILMLLPLGDFFNYIYSRWANLKRNNLLASIPFVILLVYSAHACISPEIWKNAVIRPKHVDMYENLFMFIQDNIPEGYNIYSHFQGNTGAPIHLYRIKHKERRFIQRAYPEGMNPDVQLAEAYFDSLYEFCHNKKAMYVLFAKTPQWKFKNYRIEYAVSQAMLNRNDQRFILIENFKSKLKY